MTNFSLLEEMAIYDHESDFVRWGLGLLNIDDDPALNYGYYGDGLYRSQSYGAYYDTEPNNVENDEIIAHTLQEEFSRLDVAESSGYSHRGEDQLHGSALVHAWQSPQGNYSSGKAAIYLFFHTFCHHWLLNYNNHEFVIINVFHCADHDCGCHEESVVPYSSCSSPGDQDEYLHSLELSDENAQDDEVCWKLDQMAPIPVSLSYPEIRYISRCLFNHTYSLILLPNLGPSKFIMFLF